MLEDNVRFNPNVGRWVGCRGVGVVFRFLTSMSKKFDVDFMRANCDEVVICLIYGQFKAIQTPDHGAWCVKRTFLIILVTFYLIKS